MNHTIFVYLCNCILDIEPGHIPGSISLQFMDLLNIEERTIKSNEEMKEIFKKAGVDLTKPLVGSCGTGVMKVSRY